MERQVQTGLNPTNWLPGAGTGYVPFNPDNPNPICSSDWSSENQCISLVYFLTLDYDSMMENMGLVEL